MAMLVFVRFESNAFFVGKYGFKRLMGFNE